MVKAIKINHVTLLVDNKKKAEEFYTEILGFEKYEIGNSLWIKVGDGFIHLTESPEASTRNSFYHFGIEIQNVQEYIKELISKGLKIFDLDKKLNEVFINSELNKPKRQFFLRDIDGNLLEFIEANSQFFNPVK